MAAISKKNLQIIGIVLSLIIAFPTLIFQYFVFREYQKKKSWPIVKARIIKTRIVGRRAILPEITYQYKVKGKIFQGQSDLQTPPFGLRNKRDITARAILREHPVGSFLKIAYNPENPQQSTTGIHLPWNFYMQISFAITLLLISSYLAKISLKKAE